MWAGINRRTAAHVNPADGQGNLNIGHDGAQHYFTHVDTDRARITVAVLVVVVVAAAYHSTSTISRMVPPTREPLTTRLVSTSAVHINSENQLSAGAAVIMKEAAEDVQQEIEMEDSAPMAMKDNMTVYLQGEPKSGTTWMELVINDLTAKYKAIGMCTECSFEGIVGDHDRILHNADIALENNLFRDLNFIRDYKHDIPLANGEFLHLKGRYPYACNP